MTFKIGDIVEVKQGVLDPDFGDDIGGWQGKISDVDGDLVCIDWDNTTLSNCPDEYIQRCEEDGLDWEQIYLSNEDIEPAIPRITPANLTDTKKAIHLKHQWDHLGESISNRIHEILKDTNISDEYAVMDVWGQYLSENLSFPFNGEITSDLENVPLQQGDNVKIHSIIVTDDHYGVIMKLRQGKYGFDFPLCNIRVVDEKSNNYQLVDDYCVWFSNR